METNPKIDLANDFLQYTGVNVFLTGKAGTGKTTFLRELKIKSPKRMIVVAPTGVAAINAGGVTIHSFFQLPFGPYIPGVDQAGMPVGQQRMMVNRFSRDKINIIRSLDLLVIDEISMVRADLLDAMSDVLRRYRDRSRPFGGVQLLMIGDLQQLAPVVKEEEWELLKPHYESAFFFHSKALREISYVGIELMKVYRQSDNTFIRLLNKIRDNEMDEECITELNRRYIPGFNPDDHEGYITLTTHNYLAQQLNNRKLNELEEKAYCYKAGIEGNFPEYSYPTDESLVLKKGAQVMFVKNDSSGEKRYFNGKIGVITAISSENIVVRCGKEGKPITVEQEEWTNVKYAIAAETNEITETIEGKFKQYPLKAAWAITIHKSQGLTFERAIVDAAAAFSHGQVYVALSRCKTLDGLVLSSRLGRAAVINDETVRSFTERVGQNQPGRKELEEARRLYFLELLSELFDYSPILRRLSYVTRLFNEHLWKLYPELTERYRVVRECCRNDMEAVGERFKSQLERLVAASADYEKDELVQERVEKGVAYFQVKTQEVIVALLGDTHPEVDNKDVRKSLEEALGRLQQEVDVKLATLEVAAAGFSISTYLEAKAKSMIEKPRAKAKSPVEKREISTDILHPDLYNALRTWRKGEADKHSLPVYTVLQQKALLGITNTLPTTGKELLLVPGIGKKVLERYGARLLEIVDAYRFTVTDLHE